ncbi:hypothetical protein BVG16_27375 [Paenibacillus selenitireducens]|uniref:Aminoglycoside phosphotransferase domain-containing protein n=1 Tax=Paenibacillus selenitireducens TaxID=1324314 RepID=A0A1T2X1R6_9BACL|nr:phosphotransferase [Paenibacillus selenitireducens]OPA73802.1 hypothetical protein BVG16_27375 [Paenibacillus selenitireducens]
MVSQDQLKSAAASFQFDADTLVFISNSCNEVYRFTKNHQNYILRFSEKPLEFVGKIKAEVDWVSYLAQHSVGVSLPIETINHQLTDVFSVGDKWYIATAFHMAPGEVFNTTNPRLWGPDIFRKWGETMGRMHLITKSYDDAHVAVKRDHWSIWNIENPHLHQGSYQILLDKLKSLENSITALPKDRHSYGLIHNDFHPYNFHIENGDITVFDFDDSIYGWFALDIAIAATHAVWWGSPQDDRESKNEFARRFLDEFLQGYFKHNQLDRYWIEQIPMFMDYRNICSFFWWLNGWDGDDSKLNTFQQKAIVDAVELIQKGLPFDGCDIRM